MCLLTAVAAAQLRTGSNLPVPAMSHGGGAVAGAHIAVPVDCAAVACVALTFDDGPDSRITPQILDILARNAAPATFFLVGREVPGKSELVRRIVHEGHEIGNHSWSHPDFTRLSPVEMRAQIQATQAAITEAGVPMPQLFRPPYGAANAAVRAHIPMPIIRWDVDTEDWYSQDAAQIALHATADVRRGGIILMHDRYDATVAALEPTIQQLQGRFKLVTVSELMELSSGDQGQFFGRTER